MNRFGSKFGFTLVELMVAVGIISILSSIVFASYNGAKEQGRDTERKTELRKLQAAVEKYKRREGSYPSSGCASGGWSSETNCGTYISGLWPDYIDVLPKDPRLDGSTGSPSGFSYRTNSDRSVYKLMIRGTVESEEVDSAHNFAPCSTVSGWCSGCNENSDIYKTSYAVWGGFASGGTDAEVKSNTENVICAL